MIQCNGDLPTLAEVIEQLQQLDTSLRVPDAICPRVHQGQIYLIESNRDAILDALDRLQYATYKAIEGLDPTEIRTALHDLEEAIQI